MSNDYPNDPFKTFLYKVEADPTNAFPTWVLPDAPQTAPPASAQDPLERLLAATEQTRHELERIKARLGLDAPPTADPTEHPEARLAAPWTMPTPATGLVPPTVAFSTLLQSLSGPSNGVPALVPMGSSVPMQPIALRDIRKTVLHDMDGGEVTIRATEEVRIVDPRTGAQTFVTTEHQFMSSDGTLITEGTTLYTCAFCKRGLLTHILRCGVCGGNVCPNCVRRHTSGGETIQYCPRHEVNSGGGLLALLALLFS